MKTMLFTLHRGKEYQYIEMVDYNDTDNNIEACCTNAEERDGTRYFLVFPRYAKNLSTHFFLFAKLYDTPSGFQGTHNLFQYSF